MRTSRLEAFSDGVLAIIITIMVLDLREPTGADAATIAGLWHVSVPGLLSYLLSFVYVGIYWTNHHHMFQLTDRVTGGILWANLGLLFCLSLFPFTTQWADETGYARTPVFFYALNLLLAGAAYWILQAVIIRSQGPHSALRKAVGRDFKGKASPAGYLIGCVAALFGTGTGFYRPGIWVAVACFIVVAALWIIPDRRIETIVAAHPELAAEPPSSEESR
jgi:uncharacterized membrane protein